MLVAAAHCGCGRKIKIPRLGEGMGTGAFSEQGTPFSCLLGRREHEALTI